MHALGIYTTAPLLVQIAATYILKDTIPHPETWAFSYASCLVNLPICLFALSARAAGIEEALLFEAWATTATMLQALFYYGYEQGAIHRSRLHALVFCGFMLNEMTMYGGNWFGHQVALWMSLFFSMRAAVGLAQYRFGKGVAFAWKMVVYAEFATMSAIPLHCIWTQHEPIGWFIIAFVVQVPLLFPTSNANCLPSEARSGLMQFMPVVVPPASDAGLS